MKVKVKLLSHVQLFATPQTVACQAPLSMEFSRQEYWSGLPCPSPGNLLNPGIEPESPALQTNPYRLSRQGSPQLCSPSHLPRYQGVKLKQISGGEAKSTFFPPILILDIIILKNLCHLSILTEQWQGFFNNNIYY